MYGGGGRGKSEGEAGGEDDSDDGAKVDGLPGNECRCDERAGIEGGGVKSGDVEPESLCSSSLICGRGRTERREERWVRALGGIVGDMPGPHLLILTCLVVTGSMARKTVVDAIMDARYDEALSRLNESLLRHRNGVKV